MQVNLVQDDLVRRAELFTLIADLVRAGDALPSAAPASMTPPSPAGPPRLAVIDRRLFCNGVGYDLARRPLMLKLFKVFLASPDGWIGRDELMREVYGLAPDCDRSPRYVESVLANGVKLISRARALTAGFLTRAAGPGHDWLAYDTGRRAWQLSRPTAQESISA